MVREYDRKLVLENGNEYLGYGFGGKNEEVLEIVFNTSMVGYQEILSDPSYTYQAVVMTYPLIGNYGIADDDFETKVPTLGAMIVREYNDYPSNFRYTKTLAEIMEENKIPGISGVDTRALTRVIRDQGSMKAILVDTEISKEEAMQRLKNEQVPTDAVSKVSCKKRWYSRTTNPQYNVVAVDCGIKLNIIRNLNKRGCNVTVVPWDITKEEVIKMKPDGLFLSNGPGNPEDVNTVIKLIKEIKGEVPIFGICLGHQLISLAYGAKTYKLKFGHRGGNHAVKNLKTEKIEMTSQNHSYAVEDQSLEGTGLEVTHIDILDGTIEGVEHKEDRVFCVQYHPESAPGPQDSAYLFDNFIELMKGEI